MKFQTLHLFLSALPAAAVLYGDEQFGDIDGGHFWAFHSSGISIVNPANCEVERTFAADKHNLPSAWYDGTYMEDSNKRGYAMFNSGTEGEILAISTHPSDYDDPVKGRVAIGPRPVHSYAVYPRSEYWSHSDGDGHFYVVNVNDVTKHIGQKIVAKVEDPNHGKLLWDEGEHLAEHGFGTSTGERVIFVFNMLSHETVAQYNYTNDIAFYPHPNYCRGTHAISYSNLNNHLYIECTAGGGVLEIDVNDPLNPVFVAQHSEATGSLYETPDGSYVVAANKGGNKLHVFKPNGKGKVSSEEFTVNVPGHPSTPVFYPKGDDIIACMPLTENTNRNNYDTQGNLVCDYYSCSNAATADDVASGICLHEEEGIALQTIELSQMSMLDTGVAPYNAACERCKDESNYDPESGKCICTPNCGSCAEPNYDPSTSGVQCVSLNNVVNNGVTQSTLIPNAGSIKQGSPYASSPQCGFGRTYRTHKRGGKYEASVAHYPVNSLQVVDMGAQKFHCQVDLPGSPSRVIYVPPQSTNLPSGNGSGSGGSGSGSGSGTGSGSDDTASGSSSIVSSFLAIVIVAISALI